MDTEEFLAEVETLNKPEMTAKAEDVGLEVHPGWTKAEIMEHLREWVDRPPDTEVDAVPVGQFEEMLPEVQEESPPKKTYPVFGRNPGFRSL